MYRDPDDWLEPLLAVCIGGVAYLLLFGRIL